MLFTFNIRKYVPTPFSTSYPAILLSNARCLTDIKTISDNPSLDMPTTTTDSISESSHSSYTITEDGAKTDTTFCSLATVNYNERPRRGKCRVKVVTKANQSTSTEKAHLCDTGTITYDWWSPMLDKREPFFGDKGKGHSIISKQRREIVDFNENKKLSNRVLSADGKIVKFKSRTQIIPAGEYDSFF